MLYISSIIVASLLLGLIDIKDQINDKEVKLSRLFIKLICMALIIFSIVMIEKK